MCSGAENERRYCGFFVFLTMTILASSAGTSTSTNIVVHFSPFIFDCNGICGHKQQFVQSAANNKTPIVNSYWLI